MAALARQAATRSRAEQYGTLMRDEYAKRYDDPVYLCKEAFRSLLASILGDASVDQRSYYEELLGRCIDWATSKLVLEPAPADQLPYPEFLPDHFLNSPAARLFLPINREAEEIFFETLCQSGDQATAADARAIKLRLKQCRNRIDTLSTGTKEEKAKLVLDAYDTEIVIGKHLEAVVSRFEFSRDK
jgi:hypothetical protein